MKDRQERVIAVITIRKLRPNTIEDGKEYAVVVEFGEDKGRIIREFKTYDETIITLI